VPNLVRHPIASALKPFDLLEAIKIAFLMRPELFIKYTGCFVEIFLNFVEAPFKGCLSSSLGKIQ
jgi:hypothetical protein